MNTPQASEASGLHSNSLAVEALEAARKIVADLGAKAKLTPKTFTGLNDHFDQIDTALRSLAQGEAEPEDTAEGYGRKGRGPTARQLSESIAEMATNDRERLIQRVAEMIIKDRAAIRERWEKKVAEAEPPPASGWNQEDRLTIGDACALITSLAAWAALPASENDEDKTVRQDDINEAPAIIERLNALTAKSASGWNEAVAALQDKLNRLFVAAPSDYNKYADGYRDALDKVQSELSSLTRQEEPRGGGWPGADVVIELKSAVEYLAATGRDKAAKWLAAAMLGQAPAEPRAAIPAGLADEYLRDVVTGEPLYDEAQVSITAGELRALLAAPQGIPAGWKLVPEEPTQSMFAELATFEAAARRNASLKETWREMLKGAPQPPALRAGEDGDRVLTDASMEPIR